MKRYLMVRKEAEPMASVLPAVLAEVAGEMLAHYHHTHHHHHHKYPEGEGYVAPETDPLVATVLERMENPPVTWAAYAKHPESLMAIIAMEYQELLQARASGDEFAVTKELTDLAAACMEALNAE